MSVDLVGRALAETASIREDENAQAALAEGWKIGTPEAADWALRRIGALQAFMAGNEAVAQANIAREQARLEKLNASLQADVDFFTNHLKLYAGTIREQLLATGKKKRVLSHGSFGWHRRRETLEVKDPAALLAWAEAQKDDTLVRVKREAAWSAIKERCLGTKARRGTGEIPDGCESVAESEEFAVKTEASNGSEG